MHAYVAYPLRTRHRPERAFLTYAVEGCRPYPPVVWRSQDLAVACDKDRVDQSVGQAREFLVENLEVPGDRLEKGDSPIRAHPDIVMQVAVYGTDSIRRQRRGVIGIVEVTRRGAGGGIQYRHASAVMTYINPPVGTGYEANDLGIRHSRNIGAVVMGEFPRADIIFFYAPSIGAEPEISGVILGYSGYFAGYHGGGIGRIVEEELGCPPFRIEGAEALALGRNPERIRIPVHQHRIERIARDVPVLSGIGFHPESVETVQALFSTYPKIAVAVGIQGYDEIVGKAVACTERLDDVRFNRAVCQNRD